jgi:hypothetical protein
VNAALVQCLGTGVFYTCRCAMLAQMPWQHWVISSCPGLDTLNTLWHTRLELLMFGRPHISILGVISSKMLFW